MTSTTSTKAVCTSLTRSVSSSLTFRGTNINRHVELLNYYTHCFPLRLLFEWLNKASDDMPLFQRSKTRDIREANDGQAAKKESPRGIKSVREIAFTLDDDKNTYLRHLSFNHYSDMREIILKHVPSVVHIGALYENPLHMLNITPERLKEGDIIVRRELVFDIDINSYDDILDRTKCCGSKDARKVCSQCWIIMKAAIMVLENILRKDFGFKHVYFFYSGRRGIHCWVLDKRAVNLDHEGRKSICKYMFCHLKKNNVWLTRYEIPISRYSFTQRRTVESLQVGYNVHPAFKREYETLKPLFKQLCEYYGICKGPKGYQDILDRFLDNPNDRYTMRLKKPSDIPAHLRADDVCLFEWLALEVRVYQANFNRRLEFHYRNKANNGKLFNKLCAEDRMDPTKEPVPSFTILTLPMRVVFHYMYPRIDREVTTGMTHLIKSPFSVHQETGRIAVPIDPSTVTYGTSCEFDPDKDPPTIQDLLAEISAMNVVPEEGGWRQTKIARFARQFADIINRNKQL